VVVPPVLQPLVRLPTITLPEDEQEVKNMASVLSGLHQLEEQDLEARAAFPIRWGMLWNAGLDGPQLKSLLPADLLHEQRPDPATVVPQRTVGALRRALDKMAIQWELKHAETVLQAEVSAGAATFHASVMCEAKRIQQRKRLPSAELTPDGTAVVTSTSSA
jgi:hypothetical protein